MVPVMLGPASRRDRARRPGDRDLARISSSPRTIRATCGPPSRRRCMRCWRSASSCTSIASRRSPGRRATMRRWRWRSASPASTGPSCPMRGPGARSPAPSWPRSGPDTRVLVLGNHGLVVAGDSVAEAADLLDAVSTRLRLVPRAAAPADIAELERAGGGLGLSTGLRRGLPRRRDRPGELPHRDGGSYYPDHVIFLGPAAVALPPGAEADGMAALAGRPTFRCSSSREPACCCTRRRRPARTRWPAASPMSRHGSTRRCGCGGSLRRRKTPW